MNDFITETNTHYIYKNNKTNKILEFTKEEVNNFAKLVSDEIPGFDYKCECCIEEFINKKLKEK